MPTDDEIIAAIKVMIAHFDANLAPGEYLIRKMLAAAEDVRAASFEREVRKITDNGYTIPTRGDK